MVESVAGLECLDEIASVPGLDAIQLGPGDLVLSKFGVRPPEKEAAELVELAHQKMIEVARRQGIRAAANAPNPARAKQLVRLGYDLIFLGCDLFDMEEHYRSALVQLRDLRSGSEDPLQV